MQPFRLAPGFSNDPVMRAAGARPDQRASEIRTFAAKTRGKRLDRQTGERPESDQLAPKVMTLIAEGRSYRWIARKLGISKNTVSDIVQRFRRQDSKPWKPLSIKEISLLFAGSAFPWWVAGGHAIEQFVGSAFRSHGDVDVLMLRRDSVAA